MQGTVNRWIWITGVCLAALIAMAAGPASRAVDTTATTQPAATQPVAFDVYGGYFVSNQFEPDAPRSFVVARDRARFDAVFGAGFVMHDRSHRLADDVFDKSIVAAAIKRGNQLWNFTMTGATVADGVLTISYTAKADPPDTAQFSSPLIVSVPKGDYEEIRFEENGKVVSPQGLK